MIAIVWQRLCRLLALGLVAALVLDGLALTAVAGVGGEFVRSGSAAAQVDDDDDDDDDDECEIEFEEDGNVEEPDGYCADQAIVRLGAGADIDAINAAFDTETIDTVASQPVFLLRLPQNSEETSFAELLAGDRRVRWAELNFVEQAPEGSPRRFYLRTDEAAPAAGDIDDAYAPELIGATAAQTCVDGSGVAVAVIDSGLDPDHPAFADTAMDAKDAWNAFSNQDGFGNVDDIGNGEDDDGDGLIDEMTGHGTHVAGIVAQTAPGAAIMPIKALDSDGLGQAFYLARAIYRAIDRNADVINLSLGSIANTRVVREAAGDALREGIFVVAAAGNSGPDGAREFPATLGEEFGVFGVAATDQNDRAATFSSIHEEIDLSAPGADIVSAFALDQPPNDPLGSPYALWSGTSMATPWVAGAAALVLDRNPGWAPDQIASRLQQTAAPIGGSTEGMGSGRLDAAAAVGCEQQESARGDNDTDKTKAKNNKGKKDKKAKKGKKGKNKKRKNRR